MKKYIIILFIVIAAQIASAQQLVFTHQPEDKVACENSEVLYIVNTDTLGYGGAIMEYNWQFNNGSWNDVMGPEYQVLGDTLIINEVSLSMNDYQFRCAINVGGDEYTSESANLMVNVIPVVDFTFEGHCFGSPTHFTNTSPGIESFISWGWDFGDDDCPDSSVFVNPNHVYCSDGIFNVILTGTDQNGCQGVVTREVEIFSLEQPEVEGPDMACSYQRNIKFFTPQDYPVYNWSLIGEDLPCYFESSTQNFDVLLNCNGTNNPMQFNVALQITDTNNCKSKTEHQFMVMTYQSAESGVLIQKPENSKMLICLLEDLENEDYIFEWVQTIKNHPEDTVKHYSTVANYKLFESAIDTAAYDYSVTVINRAENFCSSTFYFYELPLTSKAGVNLYMSRENILSLSAGYAISVQLKDSEERNVCQKKSSDGNMLINLNNFEKGFYQLLIYNENALILTEDIIVK